MRYIKATLMSAIALAAVLAIAPAIALAETPDAGEAGDPTAVAAEDQQAADAVVALIDALPAADDITSADEGAIAAARDAYNQLTSEQKSLVANAQQLTEAESYLGVAIANDRNASDADAATMVSNAIGVLPIVDLGDFPEEDYPLVMQQTEEAEALYYALTDEQKALVIDVGRIRAMDQVIGSRMRSDDAAVDAADQQAGGVVRSMITAVFEKCHASNVNGSLQVDFSNIDKVQLQAEIDAANDAYHQLTYAQRYYVPNSGDLMSLEWLLFCDNAGVNTQVDQDAAAAVAQQIDSLPTEPTAEDEAAVAAAREAYSTLTPVQKAWVGESAYALDATETALGMNLRGIVVEKPEPPKVSAVKFDVKGGGKIELRPGYDAQGNPIPATAFPKEGDTVVFRVIPKAGQTLADPSDPSNLGVTWSYPGIRGINLLCVESGGLDFVAGSGEPGAIAEYAFVMPDAPVTITAKFVANDARYTVNTENVAPTSGSRMMIVGSDGKVAGKTADATAPTRHPKAGSKVYFRSVPAAGDKLQKFNVTYTYTGLDGKQHQKKLTTGNGITKVAPGLYCFTMPNVPVTVTSEFAK